MSGRQAAHDLPDDVREILAPHLEQDATTLAAIGVAIAEKRDEAKTARATSGIETTWKEAEESYVGIDDANRHEFQDARWSKPMSVDGPVTTGRMPRPPDHRSTAFVRLTARYVDAGSAKVAEILLPADDKAFSFSETPVPHLIKAKEDTSQVVHEGLGALTRPAQPGEAPAVAAPFGPAPVAPPVGPPGGAASPLAGLGPQPPGGAPMAPGAPPAPGAAPQVPLTVRDFALEAIEIARKKAKAAEERIYDWMVESQYQAEMRKVVFDAARIGVGILKAPYPKATRQIAVSKSGGGVDIKISEDVSPAAGWVDPWNIFPDPAAGENVHEGNYILERDFMSERQVRDLKKLPGYIAAQIDAVLEEGPDKINVDNDSGPSGAPGTRRSKGRYAIWYFYGSLKREEFACLSKAAGRPPPDESKEQIYAIVTLINDRAVRATINPLDSGSFPYHSVPWQRRAGHWAGIGVAEQLKMPQKAVNAATRAMLNNAGKSSGSQIVVDRTGIIPADGSWLITPDKIWFRTGDAIGTDVRQSFMAVEIPNVTEQLMKIIEYGMQLAEESTSIPLVTQGQQGETTPDTYGAAALQNTNANQLLRSIGYAFDDFITEPVVRQFYEWLLLDPDVPDDEKGDFKINAHGSVALVERAIQDQTIAQMGQMAANPIYGINPKKWAKMFLKSKHLDPEELQYTEEEQAKIDANPVEAPAVTVAKIAADTAMKQLAASQSADQQTQASEERIAQAAQVLEGGHVQNEQARIEAEQHRTLTQETVKLHELQTRRELALLDYANKHKINLDQVKSALARTAMQLQTERELNAQNNAHAARQQQRETGAKQQMNTQNVSAADQRHRRDTATKQQQQAQTLAHDAQKQTRELGQRERERQEPPVQAPGRAANGHKFDQSTAR